MSDSYKKYLDKAKKHKSSTEDSLQSEKQKQMELLKKFAFGATAVPNFTPKPAVMPKVEALPKPLHMKAPHILERTRVPHFDEGTKYVFPSENDPRDWSYRAPQSDLASRETKGDNLHDDNGQVNESEMSGNGQAHESQQQNYQAKDYPGKGGYSSAGPESRMSNGGPVYKRGEFKGEDFSDNGLRKFLKTSSIKPNKDRSYADGTSNVDAQQDPTPKPDPAEQRQGFLESLQQAFGKPKPTPTPDPLAEKYKKIRAQNATNATGETSPLDQTIYNKGGTVKKYDDGTTNVKDDPYFKSTLSPEEAGIQAVEQRKADMRNAGLNPDKSDYEVQVQGEEQRKADLRNAQNPPTYNKGTANVMDDKPIVKPSTNPGNRSQAKKNKERSPFHFDSGTDDVPDDDMDAKAKKYGWSPDQVAYLKSLRGDIPQALPQQQPTPNPSPAPRVDQGVYIDPNAAQDVASAFAKGGKVKPKLGTGERFKDLTNKLSHQKGVTDPKALAASIGRKKFGNAKMNALAHKADGGTVDQAGPVIAVSPHEHNYAGGGTVNTSASLQPLLKEQYAGQADDKKKKFHDLKPGSQSSGPSYYNAGYAKGGTVKEESPYEKFLKLSQGLPYVPKLENPLSKVHAPADKKYPLNIPRGAHLKVPKRLKAINSISGFADGTDDVASNDVQPDDDSQQDDNSDNSQQQPTNVKMDLGDVPINSSLGPYPGEEEDAQKTVDQSTQGQIQQMIDDHDTSQDLLQQIDQALGKDTKDEDYPHIADLQKSSDESNDSGDSKDSDSDQSDDSDNEEPAPKEDNSVLAQLGRAQNSQNQTNLFNQLGKATDIMGASMGHFKPQNQEIYNTNMANADLPIKQLQQRIAMEKYDPNSTTSQTFRQYLAKFGGQDVKDLGDISAAQAEQIAPMAFKQFEAQQGQQARSQDLAERNKERLQQMQMLTEQRKEASQQRNDMMQMMLASRQEQQAKSQQDKQDAATKKEQATAAQQADQSLFGFRQPPDVKQARMDFYNAQKGLNTISSYENTPGGINSMDPQMVGNLRDEVQKIAQSGAPTEGGINKFDPRTWSGDLATAWQKVVNHPSGANAGAFIGKYKDYFNTMQGTSGNLVNSYNQSILGDKKRVMNSDDFDQRMNSEYVAPYLKYGKSTASNSTPSAQGRTVVKKGYNPTTNQTQFIYSDGTKEVRDGKL